MSAPSLVLVRALREGASLVGRPNGVVHLYWGGLTPTGRFVPAGNPVVCKQRTGKLHVYTDGARALARMTVVCRRCLSSSLAEHRRLPQDRDSEIRFFSDLVVDDYAHAARLCSTVDETHAVSRIAVMCLGPSRPLNQKVTDPAAALRQKLEAHMVRCRDVLRAVELTPTEREQIEASRADWHAETERLQHARNQEVARAKANDRRLSGGYLMPSERPTG